jgi:hypothetical protein
MSQNSCKFFLVSAVLVVFCFSGSVCLASKASLASAPEDNLRQFKDSERRAVAVSNWWKHKFKDEPAFSQAPMTPLLGAPMRMTMLRQNTIEEESR